MTSADKNPSGLASQILCTEARHSPFEEAARRLPVQVCPVFLNAKGEIVAASFRESGLSLPCKDLEKTQSVFPLTMKKSNNIILEASPPKEGPRIRGKRVAALFSGGPAAGGHNVLAGLKAALGSGNTLLGIRKGPKGLLKSDMFEITGKNIKPFFNTGGFDFLGTDRTKIKSQQQFEQVKATVVKNNLDGLVIIGGDDSNTNAAFIAEYLQREGIDCSVVGIPKTIDGDLAVGKYLPISFGYDTATKIFSELVGNLTQDAASAVKYWHFVKLMGRTASKITLEVALQTKPALALISEEIAEKNMSLDHIVDHIVRVITQRRLKGINHGVVLVPEGLIEFIPEMRTLISELNRTLGEYEADIRDLPTVRNKLEFIYPHLSAQSAQLLASLSDEIQEMLILDRDDHGNVKVSQIETEKLLIEKIRYRVSEIKRHPDKYFGQGDDKIPATQEQIETLHGLSLSTMSHFLGYEGRCGKPTPFDASFTFNLGLAAGSLILEGRTGYMAAVTDFENGGRVLGVPLSGLITCEERKGVEEQVIEKSLVETSSPAFKAYEANRDRWAGEDLFSSPGPIQHWGPTSRQIPIVVALNQEYSDYKDFNLGEETKVDFKPEE